ncbi:LuxR C-terminal-related transcriptional regulator [Flaviflexus huanghaiensis]|uniref:LuxR C-terminal-related transcriptional regulator n=1 Tax=Flaviflexus huanghaiensis TaxID=1111473 RepID=UPI001F50869C|nr:LuxR C-terminal-related transcriptional regulator [Flaviflexus huanghaiensis]
MADDLQHLIPTPWFLLTPPHLGPHLIEPNRLNGLIDALTDRWPITIAEAPSGFGKTLALAAWAQEHPGSVAWVTLRPIDRIPIQLLSDVIAALLHVYPENSVLEDVMAHLKYRQGPFHSAIEAIIEALPEDSRTIIVIDDAQASSREALYAVVVPLARYGRGRLRFVLSASRSVTWWLTRELAASETGLLRSTDFTFTRDQVCRLVDMLGGDTETAEERAELIWKETRGWPVAVQLLIKGDYQGGAALGGPTAPNVLRDYIESEVLGGLRPELRSFVLTATANDWAPPEFIAHLTGDVHSAALLEECRMSGLFIELHEGKNGRTHLRWHSSFAQSCREIAKRTDPQRFDENQRKATEWVSTLYPAKAMNHALLVSDPEYAVEAVEDLWLQMITTGHASILETYTLKVSRAHKARPSLLYIRACCRQMEGDSLGARMLKAQADRGLLELSGPARDKADVVRTFADLILFDGPDSREQALEAAADVLENADLTQSLTIHGAFLTGWTHLEISRRSDKAIGLLSSVATNAKIAGYTPVASRANVGLAAALAQAGEFTVAAQMLDAWRDESESETRGPLEGGLNSWSSGFIALWQGDPDKALAIFRSLDEGGGPASIIVGLARTYFAYSYSLARDAGDVDEAMAVVDRIPTETRRDIPWQAYKIVATASILSARGDRHAAIKTLDGLERHTPDLSARIMGAALWRRLGFPDEAFKLVQPLEKVELPTYGATSRDFTLATRAWAQGEKDIAHRILERCLAVAAREGITKPFMRMDEASTALMSEHASWGTKYEKFIAARLISDSARDAGHSDVGDMLSDREREVFAYLRTTLTAEEIARELFVSPATVRSHQASIYRKLGVSSRREAVQARV